LPGLDETVEAMDRIIITEPLSAVVIRGDHGA
jgi:hypothetical protein